MDHIIGATQEKSYGLKYVVRKLFIVCIGLLLTLFIIQTAKLATVGRMGAEISRLEVAERELKMENEILRSKISELRSSKTIEDTLQTDEGLAAVEVNIIPSVNLGANQAKTDLIASQ